MTLASKAEAAADLIEAEARDALRTHGTGEGGSRKVVVQHLATTSARSATSRLAQSGGGDAEELVAAHQLIAELAVRLAERERR